MYLVVVFFFPVSWVGRSSGLGFRFSRLILFSFFLFPCGRDSEGRFVDLAWQDCFLIFWAGGRIQFSRKNPVVCFILLLYSKYY